MQPMTLLNRRLLLTAGVGTGLATTHVAAAPQARDATPAQALGLVPDANRDQSRALQAAIDRAAASGAVLSLPAGTFVAGGLMLRPGTRIAGIPGATILSYNGQGTFITASNAKGIRLTGLTFDGILRPLDAARAKGLLALDGAADVVIDACSVTRSVANGIVLNRASGRVTNTTVDTASAAGIFSLDAVTTAGAMEFAHNHIHDCADNGLLIWRSAKGEDGSRAFANVIERIGNKSGGTGEYGNGINVFRAGAVQSANNRITDCSYSAIRGNAASNISMTANTVLRLGEVALYAEFGFEGAMIANNTVDGAATGISVVNYNEGGRLAVIHGNLVRNLRRREHEPVDKRGEGISVEADASVSNNVIENAPTAGILIGWGRYMRDVVASGNLIRSSRIGIAVTGDATAGTCLIASNLISGAKEGAVRAMDHARPLGTDLTAAKSNAFPHITVTGNAVS
jgi:uncharacterized secreted repeat protein (TIGR03808 family)